MKSTSQPSEEKEANGIIEGGRANRTQSNNSITNGRTENKGGDKTPKVHVHVPPRIDDEWYQVDAPEPSTERPFSVYSDWLGSHSALCSYEIAESPEVLEFISYARGIFESNIEDVSSEMPLESDARAYEFLASCNNDVELAKFFLHSTLSFGKDFVHTKAIVGAPVSSAAQLEDRLHKLGVQYPMFGAYESSDKTTSRSYTTSSSRSGDAYGRAVDTKSPTKSPSANANYETGTDEIVETSLNDGEKRQRFDKQEMKKRWHILFKQVGNAADLLLCTKKDRSHIRDLLVIVDEVGALPPYVESPGESSMSLYYPKLREIVRAVQDCRIWCSKVNDLIHEGYTLNRKLNTASLCKLHLTLQQVMLIDSALQDAKAVAQRELEQRNIIAERMKEKKKSGNEETQINTYKHYIEQLRAHLNEGSSLALRTDEEELLTQLLSSVERWNARVVEAFGLPDRGTLDDNSFAQSKTTRHPKSRASKTKVKGSVVIMVELIAEALSLPLATLDETFQDLLALYKLFLEAHEDISNFLYQSSLAQHSVAAKKTGMPKIFHFEERKEKLQKLKEIPFEIDGLDKFESIIKSAEKWKKEIADVADSTVSIRKVEYLMNLGESYPFDFSTELQLLKDKRLLAKQWVDKVKASLVRGSTRNPRRGENAHEDPPEKPKFDELKQIVSEGEQFLTEDSIAASSAERAQSKEMNRVVSIVEAAEEWQTKLRETVSSSETDTANALIELKELLQEAENMPVVMDEVHVLNVHLRIMEWGMKVKNLLASKRGGSLTFKESKDFVKELDTIYNTVNPAFRAQVKASVKITEESIVREYTREGQHWTSKSKDMVQGNIVKKGALLKRLKEVYDLGISMKVDLSAELTIIRSAINAAEAWIVEYEKLLIKLNMHKGTVEISSSSLKDAVDKNDDEVADAESSDNVGESYRRTGGYHSGVVDISHITRAVNASSGLAASFEEIVSLRKLFDKCNDWLRRYKVMCPARLQSKRKSTSSAHATNGDKEIKPSIDDLQCMLGEIESIGVAFPDEKSRLLSAIESFKQWENEAPSFHEILEKSLTTIADNYSNVALEDRFPFPCLANVSCINPYEKSSVVPANNDEKVDLMKESVGPRIERVEGTGNVEWEREEVEEPFDPAIGEEEQYWDDFTSISDNLSMKLREYDELFLSIKDWDFFYFYDSIFQWINSARRLLCNPDWENNFEEEVLDHIKDVLRVYPVDQILEGNKKFENCVQISPEVLDALILAISAMTKEIDDDVHERKSSRRKVDFNWADRIAKSTSITSRKRALDEDMVQGEQNVINDATLEDTLEIEKEDTNEEEVTVDAQEVSGFEKVKDEQHRSKKAKKGGKGTTKVDKTSSVEENTDLLASPKPKFESVQFLRAYKDSEFTLSKSMSALLGYWIRSLLLLHGRLIEASKFLAESQRVKNQKATYAEISSRVVLAKQRNLPKKYRQILENVIMDSTKWRQKVRSILKPDGTIGKARIEEVQELFNKGEKLTVVCDELDELGFHMLQYRKWIQMFEKSGVSVGLAINVDLNQMLEDGKALLLDVSEQLDIIQSNSKAYCICRMHYYGDMIGCDHCDEWYHLSCVGLTSAQVETVENYTCIRCAIKDSFIESTKTCVKICDTWNNMTMLKEQQRQRVIRLSKRISRDQSLLRKREAEYKLLNPKDSRDTSSPASGAQKETAIAMLESSENSAANASSVFLSPGVDVELPEVTTEELTTVDEAQNNTLKTLLGNIQKLKDNLESLRVEETDLRVQTEFELSNYETVVAWMKKMERIIKAEEENDKQKGCPVLSPGGIPAGILDLLEGARSSGIDRVTDISLVIDKFRWMSWCYSCLYALRLPLTENLGKFLQGTANSIKHRDESIVKNFGGILLRSLPWKKKVRKLLDTQPKEKRVKLEVTKPSDGLTEDGCVDTDSMIVTDAPVDTSRALGNITTMTSNFALDVEGTSSVHKANEMGTIGCNEDSEGATTVSKGGKMVDEGLKTVFVDATKVVFAQQESSQIALSTRLKPLIKIAIDKCHAKLIKDGKIHVAESLIRFHHPDELSQDVSSEKNTKKQKEKVKEKDSNKIGIKDAERNSSKRNRSKCIPELSDLQVPIVLPDAFSSDEEDSMVEDSVLDIEDISNRNSVSFLLYIKYQKTLNASICMADDPKDLWPVDLSSSPVVTENQNPEPRESIE